MQNIEEMIREWIFNPQCKECSGTGWYWFVGRNRKNKVPCLYCGFFVGSESVIDIQMATLNNKPWRRMIISNSETLSEWKCVVANGMRELYLVYDRKWQHFHLYNFVNYTVRSFERDYNVAFYGMKFQGALQHILKFKEKMCARCGNSRSIIHFAPENEILMRNEVDACICEACYHRMRIDEEAERKKRMVARLEEALDRGAQWNGERAVICSSSCDDFGPCGCGFDRAIYAIELPRSWKESANLTAFLSELSLERFAKGYDYRNFLLDGDDDWSCDASLCGTCILFGKLFGLLQPEIGE